MGYRWYQAQGVPPLFPFGYGLSYTTFELTDVSVDPGERPGSAPITVGATLTNTGRVAGAEVVQVYLGLPASTNQPPKRLVGFQKVKVEPGASEQIRIVVDPEATNHPLSVWSYCERNFTIPSGDYTVYVGTSSDDTPFHETFSVGA